MIVARAARNDNPETEVIFPRLKYRRREIKLSSNRQKTDLFSIRTVLRGMRAKVLFTLYYLLSQLQ